MELINHTRLQDGLGGLMELAVTLALTFALLAVCIPCLRYVPTCLRDYRQRCMSRRQHVVPVESHRRTAPTHLGKRAWELTAADMARSEYTVGQQQMKSKRKRRRRRPADPIGTPWSGESFNRSGTLPQRGATGCIIRTQRLQLDDGLVLDAFGTKTDEKATRDQNSIRMQVRK